MLYLFVYMFIDDSPETLGEIRNLRLEQEFGIDINYRCVKPHPHLTLHSRCDDTVLCNNYAACRLQVCELCRLEKLKH